MKKILIIEDDAVVRMLVAGTLRGNGYEVLEADDGGVGLDLATNHMPDLIISDINMEKMDGYTALALLRQETSTAAIPMILMTGQTSEQGMRQGMELGADDYLQKPFSVPQLLAAVEARLKKQRVMREQAERKLEELRASINMSLPHELLTPLNGILGLSEMLIADASRLAPEEIIDMATDIHGAGKRLHRLFQNYLIYAQIEMLAVDSAKMGVLRSQPTKDLVPWVEGLARRKAQFYRRSSDLVLKLAEAEVAMSQNYLRKIIEELVDNAFKFSPAGTPILVVAGPSNEGFSLTVSDRGRGMSAEDSASVGAYLQFERKFYEQQGIGLGLCIAKRLVEIHGGDFKMESTLGQGTTILVNLPVPPAKGDVFPAA